MSSISLTRGQVLNYRVVAQNLEGTASESARDDVLSAGVRDGPPGRTAHVALRVRGMAVDQSQLALVHSLRAAPHLHRTVDLADITAALLTRHISELANGHLGPFGQWLAEQRVSFSSAVDEVAEAMRTVTADGGTRGKPDLSTALNDLVDHRLRPWCPRCAAHHVHDVLFRYATLKAGLLIVAPSTGPVRYVPGLGAAPAADQTDGNRSLVLRFLRLCGPARVEYLARWLAITPAAARGLVNLAKADLVQVTVDGHRAWMRNEDLDVLRRAPAARAVRLLPPYDPVTELADRELLLPERTHRAAVWRAVANPGVLLVRGEILGVWRRRATVSRLTITIQPFQPLDAADKRAAHDQAVALFEDSGVAVDTRWE